MTLRETVNTIRDASIAAASEASTGDDSSGSGSGAVQLTFRPPADAPASPTSPSSPLSPLLLPTSPSKKAAAVDSATTVGSGVSKGSTQRQPEEQQPVSSSPFPSDFANWAPFCPTATLNLASILTSHTVLPLSSSSAPLAVRLVTGAHTLMRQSTSSSLPAATTLVASQTAPASNKLISAVRFFALLTSSREGAASSDVSNRLCLFEVPMDVPSHADSNNSDVDSSALAVVASATIPLPYQPRCLIPWSSNSSNGHGATGMSIVVGGCADGAVRLWWFDSRDDNSNNSNSSREQDDQLRCRVLCAPPSPCSGAVAHVALDRGSTVSGNNNLSFVKQEEPNGRLRLALARSADAAASADASSPATASSAVEIWAGCIDDSLGLEAILPCHGYTSNSSTASDADDTAFAAATCTAAAVASIAFIPSGNNGTSGGSRSQKKSLLAIVDARGQLHVFARKSRCVAAEAAAVARAAAQAAAKAAAQLDALNQAPNSADLNNNSANCSTSSISNSNSSGSSSGAPVSIRAARAAAAAASTSAYTRAASSRGSTSSSSSKNSVGSGSNTSESRAVLEAKVTETARTADLAARLAAQGRWRRVIGSRTTTSNLAITKSASNDNCVDDESPRQFNTPPVYDPAAWMWPHGAPAALSLPALCTVLGPTLMRAPPRLPSMSPLLGENLRISAQSYALSYSSSSNAVSGNAQLFSSGKAAAAVRAGARAGTGGAPTSAAAPVALAIVAAGGSAKAASALRAHQERYHRPRRHHNSSLVLSGSCNAMQGDLCEGDVPAATSEPALLLHSMDVATLAVFAALDCDRKSGSTSSGGDSGSSSGGGSGRTGDEDSSSGRERGSLQQRIMARLALELAPASTAAEPTTSSEEFPPCANSATSPAGAAASAWGLLLQQHQHQPLPQQESVAGDRATPPPAAAASSSALAFAADALGDLSGDLASLCLLRSAQRGGGMNGRNNDSNSSNSNRSSWRGAKSGEHLGPGVALMEYNASLAGRWRHTRVGALAADSSSLYNLHDDDDGDVGGSSSSGGSKNRHSNMPPPLALPTWLGGGNNSGSSDSSSTGNASSILVSPWHLLPVLRIAAIASSLSSSSASVGSDVSSPDQPQDLNASSSSSVGHSTGAASSSVFLLSRRWQLALAPPLPPTAAGADFSLGGTASGSSHDGSNIGSNGNGKMSDNSLGLNGGAVASSAVLLMLLDPPSSNTATNTTTSSSAGSSSCVSILHTWLCARSQEGRVLAKVLSATAPSVVTSTTSSSSPSSSLTSQSQPSLAASTATPTREVFVADLSALRLAFWVRDGELLSRVATDAAQAHFRATKDPLGIVALLLLATGKRQLLSGLCRTSGTSNASAKRLETLLGLTAGDGPRASAAAHKNAFALLAKGQPLTAAAAFLCFRPGASGAAAGPADGSSGSIGGSFGGSLGRSGFSSNGQESRSSALPPPLFLRDACDVIATRCQDPALAFLVARLAEVVPQGGAIASSFSTTSCYNSSSSHTNSSNANVSSNDVLPALGPVTRDVLRRTLLPLWSPPLSRSGDVASSNAPNGSAASPYLSSSEDEEDDDGQESALGSMPGAVWAAVKTDDNGNGNNNSNGSNSSSSSSSRRNNSSSAQSTTLSSLSDPFLAAAALLWLGCPRAAAAALVPPRALNQGNSSTRNSSNGGGSSSGTSSSGSHSSGSGAGTPAPSTLGHLPLSETKALAMAASSLSSSSTSRSFDASIGSTSSSPEPPSPASVAYARRSAGFATLSTLHGKL